MRITKISILNFLGVGAFQPGALGKLNRIEGGNGVGKSAVLKAITECLKSSGTDPTWIKIGSDKAEIAIEIDDRIRAERKITQTGTTLKVVDGEQPINSPQKFLNELLGPFNFDPTAFFLARPKERVKLLLSSINFFVDQAALVEALGDLAVPVDLTTFDYSKHGLIVLQDIQSTVYDRRREVNSDLTRMKKAVEQGKRDLPVTLDKEKYENFDLNAAVEQLATAREAIANNDRDHQQIEAMRNRRNEMLAEIERKNEQIAKLQQQIKDQEEAISKLNADGTALIEKTDAFSRPDIESIQESINNFREIQKLQNKLADIERMENEAAKTKQTHEALDRLHKALTGDVPKKMLSQVKLPVKGLEIAGDTILVDGKSIDKLSTSEQMKFAVQVAKATAGKLKAILVDRFESLDHDARKAFIKEAGKDDFEIILTEVTSGDLRMETTGDDAPAKKSTGVF